MMEKKIKYVFASLLLLILIGCSEDRIINSQKGNITGKAVIQGSNEPLENVKVSTNPNSSTVFTDENGDFTLSEVPVDDYSVQAEKEGFLAQFEGVTVIADSNVNVIFEMNVETANNRAPDTPILVTPADNAVDQEIELDLIWTASDPDEDVLTFSVELRNDQNTDVLLFEEVTDTMYTVSGLLYGAKYFWQVFASDDINDPVPSAVSSFETLQFPVSRFLFVRKINGNNVIFSTDQDGNEIQLTPSSMNAWRPRKANLIDKVAFLGSNGGDIHLYTMDPDGSNISQLTSNIEVAGFNAEELDFSWRFNDTEIIYPNFDNLYSIPVNGGSSSLIYTTTNGNFISECDWNSDGTKIALKTNNSSGYNVEIFTINMAGTLLDTVLTGVSGAAGGIDWSVTDSMLLYTYDISAFENPGYRQLDSRLFLYDFGAMTATDVSTDKTPGTNDLDPRFSPNEAEIIFMNTSNDGVSQEDIYSLSIVDITRTLLFSNAKMPDWK